MANTVCSEKEPTKTSKGYVYLISTVAAVGGFLFGYDLSIVSGAVIFLKKEFNLTPSEVGFVVSSAVIGCLLGPPIIGAGFSDWLGRKKVLLVTAMIFGVGAVGTAIPRNLTEFNFFRILGGVAVGVASIVSPMYISEIAPAWLRGRLVTVNQLAIVTGSLASIFVSYLLSFTESWRWMFASEAVPVLLLIAGLTLVPESPRWLIEKHRDAEALAVLTKIEGVVYAQREMAEIRGSLRQESGAFSELLQPGMRTALFIAVMLAILQQFTGVSPLLFYTPIVFQKAGFEKASDAILQSIIVNIWNLICTVAAFGLVDRLGRRPLLLVGCSGMALGLSLMGLIFHYDLKGVWVVLVMFLCVGSYVISLAPLAWLIMSEIFPNRIRGRAMAIASFALWLAAFIGAQTFPLLVSSVEGAFGTAAGVFWIYAAVSMFAIIFGWVMVPETKGKSLEEISRSWLREKSR
jgi:sugar porter (SP) family MFS transporter